MQAHQFNISLQKEVQQQARANKFYTEKLKVLQINRYNCNSESHLQFQRNDIDLSIELKGRQIMVSEKFRSFDYGDLYLECYSKYPGTPGWMHHSQADFLACFFPERVLWINKKKLVGFFLNKLWPELPGGWFAKINRELHGRSGIQKQKIDILGRPREFTVIQAFNSSGKDKWHTIGIGLPLEMLSEFNIPGKIYLF